jgi:hypothetical protein
MLLGRAVVTRTLLGRSLSSSSSSSTSRVRRRFRSFCCAVLGTASSAAAETSWDVLLSRALFLLLVFLGCPPPLPPMWCGQRAFGGQRWCREPVCLAWPPRPPGLLWCHWVPRTDSSINIITAFVFVVVVVVVVVVVAAIFRGGPLEFELTDQGVRTRPHLSRPPSWMCRSPRSPTHCARR